MRGKAFGAIVFAAAALALVPAASADEVVHFRNGAEMTVRGHKIDGDMVKLDLGAGNSIAFPLTMVDKIASSGQDVFLNPVYHPVNQAVPGTEQRVKAPIPIRDLHITGGGNMSVRVPGGSGIAPGFRGTGYALPPRNEYQREKGVTTTPVGHGGILRKVVPPSVNIEPAPGEPATINPPGAQRVKTYPPLSPLAKPLTPAAPPATSDGKTEAGTPSSKSN